MAARSLPRAVWRFRLFAICLCLTTLAFLQSPGDTAADTKLDLTQDPVRFMARSLHLWDPQGFFGQLQNQAYGYLFPMGPFFALGKLIGLEPWVIQRLWWSLLMVLAFLGIVRLSRLLGMGEPWARIAAGLAYALCPRVVATIGPISAETWVVALTPWTLIPLAHGAVGGSARRWAAVSGLAVLCLGAVNAVATLAVLPIGAWFLLTREAGPRRRQLMVWWSVSVALACMWWALPLVLLGRYSPPFLDWIESASVTTIATGPASVLRGTTDWIAYVGGISGPAWPAGWSAITTPGILLASGLIAAVGVAGLASRRAHERTFLVGLVVLGFLVMTFGHASTGQSWLQAPWLSQAPWAQSAQVLLDGPLSPFRNLHKFDALVRLPLSIGVGWAVVALLRRLRASRNHEVRARHDSRRRAGAVLALTLLVASIAGTSLPLLRGDATTQRTFKEIPGYWNDASFWLSTLGGPGRTLVVPGASFGMYLWGRPQDEPMQVLAASDWGVRDAVPLSSAGNIRLLDAIEQTFVDGTGSPGLSQTLARMGITHLLVRNDLDDVATDAPRSVLLHQALARSPGISRVAFFGPILGSFRPGDTVYDDGLQEAYPAIEIFQIATDLPDPRIVLRDASAPWSATGASESVLSLATSGLLDDRTLIVGAAAPTPAGATSVQTDGFRRQEVGFGRVHDNRSQSLTADDHWQARRRIHDYLPSGTALDPSPAVMSGGTSSSSSSGADVTSFGAIRPDQNSNSAIDGDQSTAWVSSNSSAGSGQWWQYQSPVPFGLTTVVIGNATGNGIAPVRSWLVTTDAGSLSVPVNRDGLASLALIKGVTTTLRLTVDNADESIGRQVGIDEISGLPPHEQRLVLAEPLIGNAGPVVLTARSGARAGCISLRDLITCSEQLPRPGEEDAGITRQLSLTNGAYGATLTVMARPGPALDALLRPVGRSALVSASSTLVPDPGDRPQAAADRDPRTTWVASPLDRRPRLDVSLPRRITLSSLKFYVDNQANVSRPFGVTVHVGDRVFPLFTAVDGTVSFPATSTVNIGVDFTSTAPVTAIDRATGIRRVLPIGVTELGLGEADQFRGGILSDGIVRLPCGSGPTLVVGQALVPTSVVTVTEKLLLRRPISALPCGAVPVAGGPTRVSIRSNGLFTVSQLSLTPPATSTKQVAAPAVSASVVAYEPTHREAVVAASGFVRTLELAENDNAGWIAALAGQDLVAVQVDGWRQGWLVPAGLGGVVVMDYQPDHTYRLALLVGMCAIATLFLLAAWRRRAATALVSPAPGWGVHRPVAIAVALGCGVAFGGLVGLVGVGFGLFVAARWGVRAVFVATCAGSVAVIPAVLQPWPASAAQIGLSGPGGSALMALAVGVVVGILMWLCVDVPNAAADVPADRTTQ